MAEAPASEAANSPPEELTVGGLIARSIGTSVAQMKEHEAGLRAGVDPDHVRKTRVAVRRLRSNLRTFEEFLDAESAKPVLDELGALAAELGGVRDREVLAGRIRDAAKILPEPDRRLIEDLLRVLEEEIRSARLSAVAYLDSERFSSLFADLEALVQAPPVNAAAAIRAAAVAGSLVAGPWEKLRKGVRGLRRNPTDTQLHRIRILAKRTRYAAMAVEPAVEAAHAFAAAAADLQTVLGDHQDAVTTEAWLAAAPTSGRQAFVAGQLAGLERAVAVEMRSRWREAWKALSEPGLRAWMDHTRGVGRAEASRARPAGGTSPLDQDAWPETSSWRAKMSSSTRSTLRPSKR
jgi:CHAD domain-containing protein